LVTGADPCYTFSVRCILPVLLLAATPALSDAATGGKTVECYRTDSSGARAEMGEMA
jgi:hypothetical protein